MHIDDNVPDLYSLAHASLALLNRIKREMEQQQFTLAAVAQRSGLSQRLLTELFSKNSPKRLTIQQLDSIGSALRQEEGWLYELFAHECTCGKIQWKNVRSFLIRCTELHRVNLIENVLIDLIDISTGYLQDVFLLGEALFMEGKWQESIPFYRSICNNEIRQHSERLAVSQYRWFRTRLGRDLKANHAAAAQFAPYRHRLSENLQLDALLQLANVYFTLQMWDEVIAYADELKALMAIVTVQLAEQKRWGTSPVEPFVTDRHLVVYYGQSFLLKGNALEWMGEYEKSLQYITGYEDLSWFNHLDETGWHEVRKFQRFAIANRFNIQILMGQFDCLPDYIAYLNEHPQEWLPSMLTIMNAVNRYGYNADGVLASCKEKIEESIDWSNHPYYKSVFQQERYARLCYELAVYNFSKGGYALGIDRLLIALSLFIQSGNQNLIINCTAYFEQHRNEAARNQRETYERLMKGVIGNAKMALSPARSEFLI